MNADRLAPWYRWVEYCAFGQALERRRFAFLERLTNARRILILGEGDGRTLKRLLTIAPDAQIDVVELSGAMIARARAQIGTTDRVRFLQADARVAIWPASKYDALVTFFFLDCLLKEEARALIARLVCTLDTGGVWLVADFAIPANGWKRWHARIWITSMYQFFKVATKLQVSTLPAIDSLLKGAGMHLVRQESERWGLMLSQVWEKR